MSPRARWIAWALAASLAAAGLRADQSDLGGASMAAAWLRLPGDARLAGLGQGGAGAALGLSSLWGNPAGLATVTQPVLGMAYDRWLMDVSTQHLGLALPYGPGVIAVAMDYLDAGTVETVSAAPAPGQNAQVSGSLHPWAMAGTLSWAQAWRGLRVAGQLEAVSEQWGDGSTLAPALGFGLQAPLLPGLEAGASLSHLGVEQAYALPCELRAGLAWAPAAAWRVYGDARAPLADAEGWNLGAGVEVELNGILAARLAAVGAAADGSGGLSAGFTARWQSVSVDYAYNSGGALGGSQQLGLQVAFQVASSPTPSPAPTFVEDADEARYQRLRAWRPRTARPAAGEPNPTYSETPTPVPAPLGAVDGVQALTPAAAVTGLPLAPAPSPSPTAVPFGRLAEQKLAAALRAGDGPAALEALDRLRVREPGLARRLTRAQAEPLVALARKQGDPEEGYKLLRSALHAAGEDPRLLAGMAHLCADQQRHNEAQVYVDRALAVEPALEPELKPLLLH